MTQNRIIGIDIVKTLAIFSVIAGHFFVLNTQFTKVPFEGCHLFIQGVFYEFFLIGVPLFILATGYLQCDKTISKQFYFKSIKVLSAYLFFSILSILFKHFYLGETMTIRHAIGGILRFNAIPYGWYIELWIGLYILIPFLNILYKSISNRKEKIILLLTIYVLTALPNCFNRYNFHIFPAYWSKTWPLLYYFIGCYIKEYKPCFPRHKLFLCILIICMINPIANLMFDQSHDYISFLDNQLLMPVLSSSIFIICLNFKTNTIISQKIFTYVSNQSLDIYLCCWFFDALLYPYFEERYFVNQAQFGCFFFIIVPLVLILSTILSQIKQICFSFGIFLIKKLKIILP